ncbi:MAG: hypothetical protein GW938_02030 [Leptospira sp.]|nr:hypothetical protein [Leptospira sp.]NCS92882.1 hypothetical protein [Leptospira sp.]
MSLVSRQFWRKLKSIPKRILFIVVILFLSPIFNLLHLTFPYGWSRFQWDWFFLVLTPCKTLLLVFPIVVALGLLFKVKWAFISWVLYASSLFIYNSIITWNHPTGINFSILFQSFVLISFVQWILHKDIRSPYFSSEKHRGWRRNNRIPWVKKYFSESGDEFQSINRSPNGILLRIPDGLRLELFDELNLFDSDKDTKIKIQGKVTRINGDFAFLSISENL